MPQTNETPHNGGASWNSLVGASTESLTLSAYRAQHLIAEHGIRPELAAMVASIALGGNGHG